MTLVDTSVWIDHLRRNNARLAALLTDAQALCHPFVVGEIACGRMRNRRQVLALLEALPRAECAEHEEALTFIERHGLAGAGLGWIDMHTSARVSSERLIWVCWQNEINEKKLNKDTDRNFFIAVVL